MMDNVTTAKQKGSNGWRTEIKTQQGQCRGQTTDLFWAGEPLFIMNYFAV